MNRKVVEKKIEEKEIDEDEQLMKRKKKIAKKEEIKKNKQIMNFVKNKLINNQNEIKITQYMDGLETFDFTKHSEAVKSGQRVSD